MIATRRITTTVGLGLASFLALTACSPSEAGTSGQASAEPSTTAQTATAQSATDTAASPGAGGAAVSVSPEAHRPATPGSAENFTGAVSITALFDPTEASASSAGEVTFDPGARTAWHTHPAGQRLIITAGTGWVQEWGGPRREVRAGDVVWFAPGVKHWHGATATEAMTHIAVQDTVDGATVDWLEQVSDTQYDGR